MKNFENEYRSLVQDDMPNLWDRIEAGLVDKTQAGQRELHHQNENAEQREIAEKEIEVHRTDKQQERKQDIQNDSKMKWFTKYNTSHKLAMISGIVAACFLLIVVMPTTMGMIATGGTSESAKMINRDMTSAEAVAEALATKVSEATEGAPMKEPAMEAAPMEEGAVETELLEESALESINTRVEDVEAKKVALEDGTVIENLQVRIVEVEDLNYHCIYRASVVNDVSGTFQAGDVVEFLAMDANVTSVEDIQIQEMQENGSMSVGASASMQEGDIVSVTLTYDAEAEISLHLVQ